MDPKPDNDFYSQFKPVRRGPALPKERLFDVRLFRARECLRGWLTYSANYRWNTCPGTCLVRVSASNMQQAKSRAISCANKGFEGCEVLAVYRGGGGIFDANNFPELKDLVVKP